MKKLANPFLMDFNWSFLVMTGVAVMSKDWSA